MLNDLNPFFVSDPKAASMKENTIPQSEKAGNVLQTEVQHLEPSGGKSAATAAEICIFLS